LVGHKRLNLLEMSQSIEREHF